MSEASLALLESTEKWARQMVAAGADPEAVGLCVGASLQQHATDWVHRSRSIGTPIARLHLDLDPGGAELLDAVHMAVADAGKYLRSQPSPEAVVRHRTQVVGLVQALIAPDRVVRSQTRDALHDVERTVNHLLEGAALVELARAGMLTPTGQAPDPSALGVAAYRAYGAKPPWWSHLPSGLRWRMAARTVRSTFQAAPRTGPLDAVYALREAASAQCQGMRECFEQRQRLAVVHRRLGTDYAPMTPEAIDAAAREHRRVEEEMRRAGQEERAYASTLGDDVNVRGVRRPPARVLARHLAYERVLAHADPFAVFEQTRRIAPSLSVRDIALTLEVALVHRIDELGFDHLQHQDGSVERRPAGWNLDERRLSEVHSAHAAGNLDRLMLRLQRLGAGDPEQLRVAHLVNRLQQTDLLLAAVRQLRPLATGLSTDISMLGWSRREKAMAARAFEEIEGRDLPVGPEGRRYRWDELLMRHPECRVKPARGKEGSRPLVEVTPSVQCTVPATGPRADSVS